MKIPAIRGKIGETIYYTTNLSFEQINNMVSRVDSELHTSNTLKDEIQRSLSNNYKKIKDYILNREDHFFNSLVLAVYNGDPRWTEIRYELEEDTFYNVGILHFSGDEKIFPVDGQHRVEGIKAALEENKELATENISVMLIGHSNTIEGREKSRRIFSTLNRYAKPVSLGDIIALDEDDIAAIVTRDLLEEYILFKEDRIKASNSKSISINDKKSFTSLITLYSCHVELLKAFLFLKDQKKRSSAKIKEFLKNRPDDSILEEFKEYLIRFWNLMILIFPEIGSFLSSDEENPAAELRSTLTGGNLFFRPVSLLSFVTVVSNILLTFDVDKTEEILRRYSSMDRMISNPLWERILWDPNGNRMIVANSTLIKDILYYIYNDSLLSPNQLSRLKEKYATIKSLSQEQVLQQLDDFLC